MIRWPAILAAIAIVAALFWRPAAAWWCDDVGNVAYSRGDAVSAASWFSKGLALEPAWRVLLEDHGRAVLDTDPATALAQFQAADCGEPCTAEAGDALSRLGRPLDAVNDYLAAHAVERVASAVEKLSRAKRYAEAIALERALIARLGTGMLAQADVAAAYFVIGNLDERAPGTNARELRAYQRDAIRSFHRASESAPFNEGYLLSYGFAELQFGSRRAAREAFERELELHPHESDAERGLFSLGVAPQPIH